MSSFEDFLSKLDPKDAKVVETAATRVVPKLPTASRRLNEILGGGLAYPRLHCIYGPFSTGKSTLLLQSIGIWQKEHNKVVGYVDVEGSLDKDHAANLGVNINELIIDTNKSSANVEKIVIKWLKAGIDVLVIDSISDLMPATFVDEKTGDLDESRKQIGAHAKAIKSLIDAIHFYNKNTLVVLISQVTNSFGTQHVEKIPHGGNKLEHGTTTMIRLTSSNSDAKQIKDKETGLPIARKVVAYTKKNKAGVQYRTAEYDLYYGGGLIGIDTIGELVDMCVDRDIIKKGGAWLTLPDESRVQGRDNLVNMVRVDDELRTELENLLDKEIDGGQE